MSYSQKLQSEIYLGHSDTVAAGAEPSVDETCADRPSKGQGLQRATTWISIIVGAAAVICIVALAVPYLSEVNAKKPTNVLDWWLRFGGAKPDQTFERFLQDSMEENQRQWEEMYRNSPAYQFNQNQTQWQFPASNSR